MHDVVVIGAGPAGAVTAEALAGRGFDVVVLEEHASVGVPVHCTGLLGVEAFDQFGLSSDLILGEAGGASFWGATGEPVTVRSRHVRAAVIDRAALDAEFVRRAVAAGAEVRTDARAETIEVGPRRVAITGRGLGAGVQARVAVLACGANYRFHRELGLGHPRLFLQSAQVETPFPAVSDVEVRFGRDVAPGGFAWLVPFERGGVSHARIGLMSESRVRERFEIFLASLCARAGVERAAVPEPRLKMLPLGPVERTYGDRVLAVGDAAGLVKPTTGGGIYYGLLSGQLAAGVLGDALGGDRTEARSLRRYETGWRKTLGQEIRVGMAFRKVASKLSDQSIDALLDLARSNGILPLVQERASFNWHSRAAIALLGHPSVRRIVFRTWAGGEGR